ncbi:hypothetical protein IAD21_01677 [Abditibacteriota bacterium]|nr:hypothetical protein IAD21_01677 [Abditibacteriota bacterium]
MKSPSVSESSYGQRKLALIEEITLAFDGVSREGGVSLQFHLKHILAIVIGVMWFLCPLRPVHAQTQPFQTLSYSKGEIRTLAFSPNSQLLAFSRNQGLEPKGQVQIWDLEKKRFFRTIQVPSSVDALCFSLDNELLAVGGWPMGLQIWNLRSGKLLHTLRGAALASFSPDSKSLVSLSINTYMRGPGSLELLHWDVQSGKLKKRVRIPLKPNNFTSGLALSPDWKLLAVSVDHTITYTAHSGKSLSGEMRLYDAHTGRLKRVWEKTKPQSQITAVQFSPDGKMLAMGDWRGRLILRDVKSNAIHRTIAGENRTINQIAFSQDGKKLATEGSGLIQIWDCQTGALSRKLTMRQSNYNGVAFSPDNKILAGIDAEDFHGRVNLWRTN